MLRTSHIFGEVRCAILGKPRTPLQLPGYDMEEKQTELETKNKVLYTADNAGLTQLQAHDTMTHRMQVLNSLCVSK